jgi:hypothetical protein
MRRAVPSLSLRERVARASARVRGSAGHEAPRSERVAMPPLTPTLSRWEREKAA